MVCPYGLHGLHGEKCHVRKYQETKVGPCKASYDPFSDHATSFLPDPDGYVGLV